MATKKAPNRSPVSVPQQRNGLSKSEIQALEGFCAQVAYDEIDFDHWRLSHADLDLFLTVFVTPQDAQDGGCREIRYSRQAAPTQSSQSLSQNRPKCLAQTQRIKVQQKISWPPFHSELLLHIKGAGDQNGDQVGNLKVRLVVRTPFV